MPPNPLFKPASSDRRPKRSPSPPKRFVEPLSPTRPRPVEPNYNYPAINSRVDFTVKPDQPYTATPKSRNRSASYRHAHHRTPSTIDTLAEAALAVSPSLELLNGHSHGYPMPSAYGGSEPPHKRSRSEMLPSPMVGQYASRPATSYEHINGWYRDPTQQQNSGPPYDSRLEEASLLLNFRTGGWPNNSPPPPLPLPNSGFASAPRPHANSFPQSTRQPCPADLAAQAGLLPPFNPQDGDAPRPTLPSPQQTVDESTHIPPFPAPELIQNVAVDAVASSALRPSRTEQEKPDVPQRTAIRTEELVSRAGSTDVTMSETSEGAPRPKRATQKTKTRGLSSRKSIAEKAATKRAAARKKTPDPSKVSRTASEAPQAFEVDRNRRKSFSDVPVNCETSIPNGQGHRAISVPQEIPMIIRPASTAKTPKRNKNATETVICAGCATTRESSSRNGEMDEWVSCNGCTKWFHVDCAGFKKAIEVRDVDKYFCPTCEPVHGKTTYVRKSTRAHASVDYAELQRGVLKTSEESMEHHYIQPIKDGTFQFDPEYFPRMRPELVTRDFFEKSSAFVEPICIPAEWNPRPWLKNRRDTDGNNHNVMKDGADDVTSDTIPDEFEYDAVADEGQDKLDMVMPEDLTVRQVCNLVGPHTPLDVIDVKTQNSGAKWDLGRWADYYEGVSDDKPILNVISLEVSQTKLGRMLRRPKVVRDIDLQDQVWPQKETDAGKYPKVQYYCLMSVEDSYTDFHIDFGGSSVYYHILKGKKTFFFIPPKPKHLKAYEEWNDSPEQNFTFLPNITKECYRVDLSEGDTMLIPSGWIHAVWTPETSLVIGGNFLTQMSYKNQFRVVEIEKANHTPMKFRYPFFQRIMWYNVIKYLTDDPLPEAVSQLFYSGKTFERQTPVWADFDGEIASQDERPGAKNARYYGEAEIEGLPDLLNYIFRTIMLVNGRIEGVSADQQKRVNASIPKGHGEPLEVAKTFALWTAWKRGNEYPPAWAHPDAVLPSKEEGPPKKLSARALKEMERKEAFAALKALGPDRKSERVKKSASANAANSTSNMASSTPDHHHPSPTHPPPHHQPSTHPYAHQNMDVQALPAAQPMAFAMNAAPGQHISTPKTSVLGPKRVACDQCRRRRIRCKHKDLVTQVTPNQMQQTSGGFGAHDSPQVYDNITVTPPKAKTSANPFTNRTDEQPGLSGHPAQNGSPVSNGMNGTTFPMTVNGVPVFTDATRRGRSKACFECRKSKRRCIHDENGNVDPIKAAETPVPRGSASSKKRASEENTQGSPVPLKKKVKTSPVPNGLPAMPAFPHDQKLTNGAVQPHREPPNGYQHSPAPPQHSPSHTTAQAQSTNAPYRSPTLYHQESTRHLPQEQHQPPLDPSLFGYPDPASSSYVNQNYAYPSSDRPGPYQLPSLEQIANEVLDMNGRSHEDYHTFSAQEQRDPPPVSNGFTEATRPDESVDSAISIPGSDDGKHQAAKDDDTMAPIQSLPDAPVQASVESSHPIKTDAPTSEAQTSPSLQKSSVNDLPLYKPPAPLSLSPEVSKRQPHLTIGIGAEPSAPVKRRRDSTSSTPGSKKPRMGSVEPNCEQDVQRLAKSLQQDDLGLRKRGN
ncbi:domain-containing histone demethylation 1 [Lecanosticta acicola]|uniref:JmjC domain-containing histone demethylation protein 1 n=1 Tax=Lecanosticta acicola TaxID=111012 RepID=A0AAI8YV36_9PEZI|nr:domain-containing histone demethylation 1 [Lecanosticta acicola]